MKYFYFTNDKVYCVERGGKTWLYLGAVINGERLANYFHCEWIGGRLKLHDPQQWKYVGFWPNIAPRDAIYSYGG